MISKLRRIGRLARWLGPWADDKSRPDVRDEVFETSSGHRVRRFLPRDTPTDDIWVIAPGLHFQGPDDPRMARFASVLAYAGHEVWVPYLVDYLALQIQPRAIDHYVEVVEAAAQDRPVSLFSISFGSLLALRAAGDERVRDAVEEVVIFGGFANLRDTMHFCMTGAVDGVEVAEHDPLNRPILFMHVLDHLDHGLTDDELDEVVEAWRSYMRATWGRPEMRVNERYLDVAREFREPLDPRQRALFDDGVGLNPGGWDLIEAGLEAGDYGHLDPQPHLSKIRCPVYLVHGADDDVIPYTQALELERLLREHTRVSVHLTGLYGHTAKSVAGGSIFGEIITMLQIVRVLAKA